MKDGVLMIIYIYAKVSLGCFFVLKQGEVSNGADTALEINKIHFQEV